MFDIEDDGAEGAGTQETGVETLDNPEQPKEPDTTEKPKPEEKRPSGAQRAKLREQRLEARIAELEAAKAPQTPTASEPTSKKPDYEDFAAKGKTNEEYLEALADWKAEQKISEVLSKRDTEAKERELKNERTKAQKTYAAKVDEVRERIPDYDEVIEAYDGPYNATIAQALLDSNNPEIAYYIATNPDEADKLEGMNYAQVNRFFGRIEATLESDKPSGVKPSKAPAPLSVPRGKGPVNTLDPHTNTDMTPSEWRAYRAKHKR